MYLRYLEFTETQQKIFFDWRR